MTKPVVPVPKFDRSASAKPPRIATPMPAMTHVPILDFATRRKKVSIGFPVRMEVAACFRVRAGVHQAVQLGALGKREKRMALKKLVAGNWKMHGLSSDLDEIRAIAAAAKD